MKDFLNKDTKFGFSCLQKVHKYNIRDLTTFDKHSSLQDSSNTFLRSLQHHQSYDVVVLYFDLVEKCPDVDLAELAFLE